MAGKEKDEKTEKRRTFYQNSMFVTTFLGGITFAAMVLIIQNSMTFDSSSLPLWLPSSIREYYSQTLISLGALTSFLFVSSSIEFLQLSADRKNRLGDVVDHFADAGFGLLAILLPLLILPFSIVGTIVLIGLEIFAFIAIYLT